jgi:predicted small integral membrane protein
MCIVYAAQNLLNLEAAMGFAAYVAGMQEHLVYPNHLGPEITSPVLHAIILGTICVGEFTAGVVSALGGLKLWRARRAPGEEFNAAKSTATLGAGIALLVWFGLFTAIGGAWFQFWQTDLGSGSLQGAFQYSVSIGVVALYLNLSDAAI